MTKQLCECEDPDCREEIVSDIEQLLWIREDPDALIISKTCRTPRTDVRVDEGENFYVHVPRRDECSREST